MESFDVTVFIGRFQPIHLGHLHTIRLALNNSRLLFIIMGSYKSARSIRQPWSVEERIKFIQKCLTKEEKKRIVFLPIRDRLYSEIVWTQNIIHEVTRCAEQKFNSLKPLSVALIGHNKDATSYYLKQFPNWKFIETGNFQNINSTDFRKTYFCEKNSHYHFIPNQIKTELKKFRNTKEFLNLKLDYLFVEKNKIKDNEMSCTSCFVQWGNYILLVKRNQYPGKNLFSLPEDFCNKNDNQKNKAFAFLKEKTNIQIEHENLDIHFVKSQNFNYADRNALVKCENSVFYYKLNKEESPKVTTGKNVCDAIWLSLDDFNKNEEYFYSDHFQIIQSLLGRI